MAGLRGVRGALSRIACLGTNVRLPPSQLASLLRRCDINGIVSPSVTVRRGCCTEYSVRSHGCGSLGEQHEGVEVSLAGWVQATRMDTFILLRDRTGICQVRAGASSNLHRLPLESVVVLRGIVRRRPDGQDNPKMETGGIEVELTSVVETSPAKSSLPIQQSKHVGAKEALRMQYRYLDLRNPALQHNLMLRSQITMAMRQFLVSKGFLDIETPTLFRRTPGGAKEFVVPTRLQGKFYSLVQSPQQFKQLLMVGGLDRYFQVRICAILFFLNSYSVFRLPGATGMRVENQIGNQSSRSLTWRCLLLGGRKFWTWLRTFLLSVYPPPLPCHCPGLLMRKLWQIMG